MAVIRWYDDPEFSRTSQVMDQMRREMNRLFSDYWGKGQSPLRVGVFPAVNMSEDQNSFYVRAELPGMKPDELEISVEGDTLTIRGERKLPQTGETVNYHRREREEGRFRRILTLPTRIDPDAVSASFSNGVLKIVLPKAPEVLPKQIQVKTED